MIRGTFPCYEAGFRMTFGCLGLLTNCDGVVDFEAAEHLVDVPGMEEPVPLHHHLERLWFQQHLEGRHVVLIGDRRTRYMTSAVCQNSVKHSCHGARGAGVEPSFQWKTPKQFYQRCRTCEINNLKFNLNLKKGQTVVRLPCSQCKIVWHGLIINNSWALITV